MNQFNNFIHKHLRAILTSFVVLAAIGLSGCQPGSTQKSTEAPAPEHLTGVVVGVDKAKGLVTVKHDAIPGKMDAMTMPFSPANPAVLSQLHPGDKISADFSVQANGAVLDNIKVLDEKSK
jgi:protein SCO1/2